MTQLAEILALADEHERWAAYRSVITAVAAAPDRTGDHALVTAILSDPADLVAKSAVVELVDTIAAETPDPAAFRRWASGLGLDRLAEGHREFVLRRVEDWSLYLAIETGHTPTATELNEATNFMQRLLADRSTSKATLAVLGEMGRTKKIRNIAKNRRDVH